MEYLDYYDETGKLLGKETREVIHQKGLWHQTVHCWLYDNFGNIYFQLRNDHDGIPNKMYTTASGHVQASESIKDAFKREVSEEIGIKVDIENCKLVETTVWKMDKKIKDDFFRDRAFANIYVGNVGSTCPKFSFTDGEAQGIIKANAKDVLNLLRTERGSITATKIGADNIPHPITITMDDFLINAHEIGIIKYGRVLQFIINETK